MIEQAFISGQINKAIYEDSGRYFVFGMGGSDQAVECRPGEISLFLNCGAEFAVLSGKNLNLSEIKRALESDRQAHRALSLTISGSDSELSNETRTLCIEA